MIKISIEVQDMKPETIIKELVELVVIANQEHKSAVLTSLLRECQEQLFRLHRDEMRQRLEREF